ncbi:unknown protein (plasmid) [Simkania negevensis Z]|uniref:Uncharacterized protein n=1 Tax=Simkania negevensis (strain ATCC VR-1471 / DSM 27360 / Z) TaxID=331113 RepID=F8L307_SIMNZ|nr:unknown protein [Simkania negevensis Z]
MGLVNKPHDEAGSKRFKNSFPEERGISIVKLGLCESKFLDNLMNLSEHIFNKFA